MTYKTGGPAFPTRASYFKGEDGLDYERPPQPGMTLLDWFAGQYLVGLTATKPHPQVTMESMAAESYDQAEAMIAERNKRMGSA